MAQFSKRKQKYLDNGGDIFEVFVPGDRYGNLAQPANLSAFGEQLSAQLFPVIQLDGLYGLDSAEFQLNSSGTGTQLVDSNGLMVASSGTGSGAFSTVRSKRSLRYRPGQGSIGRFTAMFPNGQVDGYQQVAGFINQSDIIGVGYNFLDDEFAVLRRYNSKAEAAKFTITAPATGAENVTITLNDTAFVVPVTSGTIQFNTAELGNAVYNGWVVDYCNNVLRFLYEGPPIDLTGTFSISSDGNLAGTYTKLQDGAAPNDSWTYQRDFNIDRLDGTGPSGMILDPTNLNVFQIDYKWLGAGRIRYSIEDDTTGQSFPFHIENYSNRNTVPSVANPSMRLGYGVVNAAPGVGTGTDVTVRGASLMGAVEGNVIRNTNSKSIRMTSGDNLASNQIHHLLTIKNNRFNENGKPNVLNQRELHVTQFSMSATETGVTGDAISFLVYKNVNAEDNLLYEVLNSSVDYSETTTTIDSSENNKLIASYAISPGDNVMADENDLRINLAPLETLSVALLSTAQTNSQAVAINFVVE